MPSHFVCHHPCPKCGSRDNLGEWSDGHKFCFGCGFYIPSERNLSNSRPITEEKRDDSDAINHIIGNCTTNLPEKPLKWLKQYGITDNEIQDFVYGYESERDYLWFKGVQGHYIGRYFGESPLPRYSTMGGKPSGPLYIGHSRYGIFCEDIISAIKIGRQYTGIPVFGSHIGSETLLEAFRAFPEVGIWLDYNMKAKVARIAQKGHLLTGGRLFRIHTKLDPKCYSDEEIRNIVEKARN